MTFGLNHTEDHSTHKKDAGKVIKMEQQCATAHNILRHEKFQAH